MDISPGVGLFLFLLHFISAVTAIELQREETAGDLTLTCPDGWYIYKTRCYRLFDIKLSYRQAEDTCNKFGSRLVQVYNQIDYYEFVQPYARDVSPTHRYWIGFYPDNLYEEGVWMDNEPSAGVHRCITGGTDTDWAYIPCLPFHKLPFMCQRDATPKVCGSQNTDACFTCWNGLFISENLLCDGYNNCGDHSDEQNCCMEDNTKTFTQKCDSACSYYYSSNSGQIDMSLITNNQDCTYTIEADFGRRIMLGLSSVLLQAGDMLEIWSGDSLLKTISGTNTYTTLLTPTHKASLVLRTDSSGLASNGFTVSYTSDNYGLDEDTRALTATTMPQSIQSPFYMNYVGPVQLHYVITSPGLITVQFQISLDVAPDTSIEVYWSRHGVTEMYSVTDSTTVYVDREANVMVDVGHSRNTDDIVITYIEGCNFGEVSHLHGHLKSPSGLAAECSWLLTAGTLNNRTMSVIFSTVNKSSTEYITVNGDDVQTDTYQGETLNITYMAAQFRPSAYFEAEFSLDCPVLEVEEGRTVNSGSISVHSEVVIICDTGYSFIQEEYNRRSNVTITCLKGGAWNVDRIPQCQVVYCGGPPHVEHAYVYNVSDSVTYGSVVTYKCEDGYQLVTTDTTTCRQNGQWSPLPTCTAVQCSTTDVLVDGQYTFSDNPPVYGSIRTATCNTGYQVIGPVLQVCQINGTWSHDQPICQVIRCPMAEIRSIQHSSVVSDNVTRVYAEYSDVFQVTCEAGYELDGNSTIACGDQGLWSSLPECNDIQSCLSDPCGVGHQCTDTLTGYICTCNSGYKFDGTCSNVDECMTENGGCDQICNDTEGGYVCSCRDGYDLYVTNGTNNLYIPMGETGLYREDKYYINHTCVRSICPPPNDTDYQNAILLTDRDYFYYEEEITFRCDLGYLATGNLREVKWTCNSDGSWNKTDGDAVCIGVPCTGLTAVEFGTYYKDGVIVDPATVNILPQEQITLQCQFTRDTFNNRTMYCAYDVQVSSFRFQGDNMTCSPISCGVPDLPVGAMMLNYTNDVYLNNGSFVFSCGEGYNISGLSEDGGYTVMCKENGRWSLNILKCLPMQCPDPGTPAGTRQIVTSYELGENVTYECLRSGFVLSDPTPKTCILSNGEAVWSHDILPECIDNEAPVFMNCPTSITFFNMLSPVNFTVPMATDNSRGVKSVSANSTVQPGDILTEDLTLTYTAEDYSGNTATCDITLKQVNVSDPQDLLDQCPVSFIHQISRPNEMVDFQVMFDATFPTSDMLVVNPSTAGVNDGDFVEVEITATFPHSVQVLCRVQIGFNLIECHAASVPASSNSMVSCSDDNSTCNVTCNSGYSFIDNTTMKALTCMSGQWSPLPSDCLEIYPADFTWEFNMVFDEENQVPIVQCISSGAHDTALDGFLSAYILTFQFLCRDTGVTWNLTRTGESTLTALTQITTPFLATQLTQGLSEADILSCVDTLVNNSATFSYGDVTCDGSEYSPVVTSVDTQSRGFTCQTGYRVTGGCVPCEAGTYTSGSACIPCPDGTYQNQPDQTECKNCSIWSAPAPDKQTCISTCPAGFRSDSGYPPCVRCEKDTYWVNSTTCTACDPNTSTVLVLGATTASDCKSPCGMGTYSVTGYPPCMPCPANFYQDEAKSATCKGCNVSLVSPSGSISGDNCTEPSIDDGCTTGYCNGQGNCTIQNHRPHCTCNNGFYGSRCEIPTHICDTSPCYNNGTCLPSITDFEDYDCRCYTPYRVELCSYTQLDNIGGGTNFLEFSSNDSLSIQICKDECLASELCDAVSYIERFGNKFCFYYTKENFQQTDDEFSTLFMKNCPIAFNGTHCEIDNVNGCENSTCSNEAMCQDLPLLTDGYRCICPRDSTSTNDDCSVDVDLCELYPCQNNGNCTSYGTVRRQCTCPKGFDGDDCEIQYDACLANPDACLNGGECIDRQHGDSYDCRYTGGFSGTHCEILADFCERHTCANDAFCINNYETNKPECVCQGNTEKYEVFCPVPRAPQYGYMEPEDIDYILPGENITYYCYIPYTPSIGTVLQCTSNGTLSGDVPVCQYVSCSDDNYGNISVQFGALATFNCSDNHYPLTCITEFVIGPGSTITEISGLKTPKGYYNDSICSGYVEDSCMVTQQNVRVDNDSSRHSVLFNLSSNECCRICELDHACYITEYIPSVVGTQCRLYRSDPDLHMFQEGTMIYRSLCNRTETGTYVDIRPCSGSWGRCADTQCDYNVTWSHTHGTLNIHVSATLDIYRWIAVGFSDLSTTINTTVVMAQNPENFTIMEGYLYENNTDYEFMTSDLDEVVSVDGTSDNGEVTFTFKLNPATSCIYLHVFMGGYMDGNNMILGEVDMKTLPVELCFDECQTLDVGECLYSYEENINRLDTAMGTTSVANVEECIHLCQHDLDCYRLVYQPDMTCKLFDNTQVNNVVEDVGSLYITKKCSNVTDKVCNTYVEHQAIDTGSQTAYSVVSGEDCELACFMDPACVMAYQYNNSCYLHDTNIPLHNETRLVTTKVCGNMTNERCNFRSLYGYHGGLNQYRIIPVSTSDQCLHICTLDDHCKAVSVLPVNLYNENVHCSLYTGDNFQLTSNPHGMSWLKSCDLDKAPCYMQKEQAVYYNEVYSWVYVGSSWLCSQYCLHDMSCVMSMFQDISNQNGGLCLLYSDEKSNISHSGIVYRKHCPNDYTEPGCHLDRHMDLWGGESSYSVIQADTDMECTEACLKDDGCTGAAFLPDLDPHTCHLYNKDVSLMYRGRATYLNKQCLGRSRSCWLGEQGGIFGGLDFYREFVVMNTSMCKDACRQDSMCHKSSYTVYETQNICRLYGPDKATDLQDINSVSWMKICETDDHSLPCGISDSGMMGFVGSSVPYQKLTVSDREAYEHSLSCVISSSGMTGFIGSSVPYQKLTVLERDVCKHACNQDMMCYHVSAYPTGDGWMCSLVAWGTLENPRPLAGRIE